MSKPIPIATSCTVWCTCCTWNTNHPLSETHKSKHNGNVDSFYILKAINYLVQTFFYFYAHLVTFFN